MITIPDNVATLLNDDGASKVLTTVAEDGVPHSIVVGSIMAPDSQTICAAEILMKKTAKNLETNKNIAVLCLKGTESYLVNATVVERQTEGELFESVAAQMKKAGLPMSALWIFKPTAIFDQSAGENAGTQIA
ncbi:pyridoxamine 5'-phosphate oxidase family protein [Sulfurospirillum diekertiae]|uniref:FMN-binding protein n=2 Tax=Sulfurospirillum TaxID=57665 RepID=A0A1Y0HL39_9BACT|nr:MULTISPECIES: pyridoxamine 5'-phosphate oxidase family protein [Sulfurospirillum]AOO65311.1 putative FMN-binding protein [Sulfurospirillum halorespirans DSM 13726]ARU48792.1 putative FMN-binding protein [Sulfurospirillum diekertiae]ASC93613.1 putative FMN-binding protein [Sulfurospirillum diekertiae]ATB69657.1 putative FMN-binding protein [Sulfurospirillum diekertiae]QIR74730.2 pyridoxamine 5'-phosphate oxidase family protein [Sulfurospirillum diekertiae]